MKQRTSEYNKKYNDKINKKWNPINNPKMMRFKGKFVVLKEKPNREQCQVCNRKIGDKYINWYGEITTVKRIHIHHIQYHNDDHLKDTLMLCASCHGRESWKQRKLK